jgi:hypothetical protein
MIKKANNSVWPNHTISRIRTCNPGTYFRMVKTDELGIDELK